jgi:hypothetical protein
MLKRSEVDKDTAQIYLEMLDDTLIKLSKKPLLIFKKRIIHFFHHTRLTYSEQRIRTKSRTQILIIMESNMRFVFDKLKKLSRRTDTTTIRKMMADCEFRLSLYQNRLRQNKVNKEALISVLTHGFQVERDYIHTMIENGRISRESAKEMRHNISLLEVQLKKDYF